MPIKINSKPAESRRVIVLARLWRQIQPHRRKQFGLLLALMFVTSLVELVSIGAVLPFLSVLTAPERVFSYPAAQPLIQLLDLQTPQSLLIPLTVLFGMTALVAGAMRVLLLWLSTRLSFATGADFGLEIYRRTLYQPYSVHIARNSSAVIDAVSTKSQGVINGVIYPTVLLISSGLMLIVVVGGLIVYEPVISLLSFAGFGGLYLLISRLTRARLQANSQAVATHATKRVKALQEGMGGIRDLLLDGTQPTYCAIFSSADQEMRRAQAQNSVLAQSPRYLMEGLGMALISLLALWFALQPGGVGNALPTMGALALAAQRLLPMLQQLYQGWSNFKGHYGTIIEVLDLLEQPLPAYLGAAVQSPLPFNRELCLDGVSFRYRSDSGWVLRDVNLRVPKGTRVGIVGTTGSGKSTLLDIIMGLLLPTRGLMLIDGVAIDLRNARAWQAHIAHVPQAIYLADTSVAQNIAFGLPPAEIDMDRVEQAATRAQLASTVEAWPAGYHTRVGERGVQLSGGQRQRIGIARALYKAADVIVLDEATSALDIATETAVMRAIDGLNSGVTVFIIAHRLSTLRNCNFIIDMSQGEVRLKQTGISENSSTTRV